jgi:hypothetical protein
MSSADALRTPVSRGLAADDHLPSVSPNFGFRCSRHDDVRDTPRDRAIIQSNDSRFSFLSQIIASAWDCRAA